MYKDRLELYKKLEACRGSKLLVYVTGDRRQLETKIHSESLDFFIHHLDIIGDVEKISLLLYTRGGDALASWSIANLIRQFCKQFEVIIPSKAHSGGTLISLGADAILMTKQATLGPIDPSVQNALNPIVPGGPPNAKVPVSVEAINGYLEFARNALGESADLSGIVLHLSQQVHPLVLGDAYRARSQIQMLARKLLSKQVNDEERLQRILQFLCSESGSHDYTINRREARDELGLRIEKPDDSLYQLIKAIYDDIADELKLTTPFDPNLELGGSNQVSYSFRRALVESIAGGCHTFASEGSLSKQQVQVQPGIVQEAINDRRSFEGWRHENA